MKKLFVAPYKMGSASAKALSDALGGKRIRPEGSRYRNRDNHVVINWGRSEPFTGSERALNKPEAVRAASNKLSAFEILSSSSVADYLPPYTTDRSEAEEWIAEGKKVVCRTLLRANSGRGIVIAESVDQLVSAPLYVKYVPKRHEYRLHVFNGQVIDVQRKMRSRDVADEDVNWQVRNHSNGFIFGREGVELPQSMGHVCCETVEALGLDFGAVDLIYNERQDKYYVLEVNTAPGLTGTTLEVYTNAVRALLED